MTLLRATARTLLASYFVASGFKSVRHPELLVPAAEPVTDKLVPFVKRYAPASVAGYVPEDAQTLVRINGAAQLVGGLALATGKGRRLGAVVLAASLIPSTLAKHPYWSRTDAVEKAEDRSHFLKNVSLLGGVLLAARDTEGRPGLVYLAAKGGESIARDTRRLGRRAGLTSSTLSKNVASLTDAAGDLAGNVGKSTGHLADGALAGGAAIVGAAVASSRKARKQASKQLKKTQVVAAKQLKETRQVAAQQAAIAKKESAKRAKVAQKARAKRDAEAEKRNRKQIKKAAVKAEKVNQHIHRGEN